jgi:hypothetical protein
MCNKDDLAAYIVCMCACMYERVNTICMPAKVEESYACMYEYLYVEEGTYHMHACKSRRVFLSTITIYTVAH